MAVPVYQPGGITNWGNIGWDPVLESYSRRKFFYENPNETKGASNIQDQYGQQGQLQLYGAEDLNRQKIFNGIAESLGRMPTESEYAEILPIWRQDPDLGRSAVSQLKEREKTSPEFLKGKAGEYSGDVNALFQQYLGRNADPSEVEHFGGLLAGNQTDKYTLGEWLKQQPEYQNVQDKAMREGLTGELQKQNEQYFSEKILPTIQSSLLRSGRSTDSSGYAAMLARAAQEQNTQRESFLNNLTAQQYMGNKAAANADYTNKMANWYDTQNYGRQRSDALADRYYARAQELQNYDIQKNAYEQYLRNYGKRSGGIGSLVGGLIGAGAGAYFGGPAGGMFGYQALSGLGGGVENLTRG